MKKKPSLESRVLQTIREHRLLDAGERVLVAVSGGADSVALLYLLLALRETLQIELIVAHFEHGIRGEASQSDALFVQTLCEDLGLSCWVGHGDVPALSKAMKQNIEQTARDARYSFLYHTAAEQKATKIALAHHVQDQAETVLLHLVHGCGLAGLSGMRYRNGVCVRPLLNVSQAELKEFLRQNGISWCEDETNLDLHYSRNLLRHKVFPILEQINPLVCQAMARTSLQAASAFDTLHMQADMLLKGSVKRMPYGAFWFVGSNIPTVDACRLFASWAGISTLDAAQSESLHQLKPSQMVNLPSGWRGMRTKDRLHLLSPSPSAKQVLKDAFRSEAYEADDYGDGIHTQVFDADQLHGAVFRYRQNGDLFAPLGLAGTQKLKKTLQDAGIDQPFRDLLPVLARDDRVLWIVGLKPSGDAAVTSHTRRKVKWTYQEKLPWEL